MLLVVLLENPKSQKKLILCTATYNHHCMKIVIFMENPKLKNRFCDGEYTNDLISIHMCSFTKSPVLTDQYLADISVGNMGVGRVFQVKKNRTALKSVPSGGWFKLLFSGRTISE